MELSPQLIHGDALQELKKISNESIDAIITDPPYGIGLADWDLKLDIIPLFIEIKRILKPTGFLAFFGILPGIFKWHSEAIKYFSFLQEIVWVKRSVTPHCRLMRGHENIYIYGNVRKKFYKSEGLYEDVKVPGIMFDVINIEGIKRHISDLRSQIKTGKVGMLTSRSNCDKIYNHLFIPSERAPEVCNFTSVWSFLPQNKKNLKEDKVKHPTQKPFLLMQRLCGLLTPPQGFILDPFMGSGTTGIAALQDGYRFMGIEKEKVYFDIAKEKIEKIFLGLDLSNSRGVSCS